MTQQKMSHFNSGDLSAKAVARWYNKIQRFAEETRLGIPVTIASIRNHFTRNIFRWRQMNSRSGVKRWDSAIDDVNWSNSLRYCPQEYLAVGICCPSSDRSGYRTAQCYQWGPSVRMPSDARMARLILKDSGRVFGSNSVPA
jgi:hypothetical protein